MLLQGVCISISSFITHIRLCITIAIKIHKISFVLPFSVRPLLLHPSSLTHDNQYVFKALYLPHTYIYLKIFSYIN
jgi:hypothetical protein